MTNGSLLLFTFFMITDPMTTPNARKPRIVWAILIGIVSFFFF
ncbi:MAG: RnfABCDGE type electron transport complex subunit D [Bacteroidia bacterium]